VETRETVPDVAAQHDVAADELVSRPSGTLWRSLLNVDRFGEVKVVHVLGWVEIVVATLLTVVIGSFLMYELHPRPGEDEGSLVAILFLTPFALAFWTCGISLRRNWRIRWKLHALIGIATLLACTIARWLPYVA
jgi:hypothetical protein